MQKPKKLHNVIFIGISEATTHAITDELKQHRIHTDTIFCSSADDLQKTLKNINTGVIIHKQTTELNLTTISAAITANNKDIPIINAYAEVDFEQQLIDSKNTLVANFIIETQTALAAQIIQRELKHTDNRRRRRRTERFLQELELRCRDLITESPKATAYLNKEGLLIFTNQSFADMLHYSDSTALLGQPFNSLVETPYQNDFKAQLSSFRTGKTNNSSIKLPLNSQRKIKLPCHVQLQHTRFERAHCIEVQLSPSLTQISPMQPSNDDYLTGLKNQLYLQTQLEKEITECSNNNCNSHLIYIKSEQSEPTNSEDDFGLQDSLIQHHAKILKNIINRAHTLVRYQENAFCILFSNPDKDKAKILAEQIHQALTSEPAEINGKSVNVTASIGIVTIGPDSFDQNVVISLAMSAASETKNGVSFYGVEEAADDSVTNEELQNAITQGQLQLLFQPIVSLCAEQKSYYEVLLRMLDKNNNQISPNEFANMLNNDDISLEIDRWVISESIKKLVTANQTGKENTLFINLSGGTIDNPQFAPWLAQHLNKADIKIENLIFQFSENDISHRLASFTNLANSLNKLKAQICIKHYGASINADAAMSQVNAGLIKLDGAFIKELADPSKHEAFDRLIEPVKKQRKTLIAPLVEDTSVISKLFMSGIGYIQGYYIQAPREQMDYDFSPR